VFPKFIFDDINDELYISFNEEHPTGYEVDDNCFIIEKNDNGIIEITVPLFLERFRFKKTLSLNMFNKYVSEDTLMCGLRDCRLVKLV
jgi:hypothetical protein